VSWGTLRCSCESVQASRLCIACRSTHVRVDVTQREDLHCILSRCARLNVRITCRWEFYFAYCEAAFDCSYIQNYQITWQRLPDPTPPHELKAVQSTDENDVWASKGCETECDSDPDTGGGSASGALTWALFSVYCILGGAIIARQPFMLAAVLTFGLGQGITWVRAPLFLLRAGNHGRMHAWQSDQTHTTNACARMNLELKSIACAARAPA
jgi:hypothetical protein